jgi:hypothetical protein
VFQVEVYGAVRRYVLVEGHSRREVAHLARLTPVRLEAQPVTDDALTS